MFKREKRPTPDLPMPRVACSVCYVVFGQVTNMSFDYAPYHMRTHTPRQLAYTALIVNEDHTGTGARLNDLTGRDN